MNDTAEIRHLPVEAKSRRQVVSGPLSGARPPDCLPRRPESLLRPQPRPCPSPARQARLPGLVSDGPRGPSRRTDGAPSPHPTLPGSPPGPRAAGPGAEPARGWPGPRLPLAGRHPGSHMCRLLPRLPNAGESHLGPTTSCSARPRGQRSLSSAPQGCVGAPSLPPPSPPREWGELSGPAPGSNDFMEIGSFKLEQFSTSENKTRTKNLH